MSDLTNARLALNDFHACSTQEELTRWRAAQLRLIVEAKASVYPEVVALRDELAQYRRLVPCDQHPNADHVWVCQHADHQEDREAQGTVQPKQGTVAPSVAHSAPKCIS